MKIALLFDDMQRATPARFAIPAILNRLNKAGVSDERGHRNLRPGIASLAHTGTDCKKVGQEALQRLKGGSHP